MQLAFYPTAFAVHEKHNWEIKSGLEPVMCLNKAADPQTESLGRRAPSVTAVIPH